MVLLSWLENLFKSTCKDDQERRSNDYVQLSIMRLEDRRVLNASPLASLQEVFNTIDESMISVEDSNAITIDAGTQANDGQADHFHISRENDITQVEVNGKVVLSGRWSNSHSLTIRGSSDVDSVVVSGIGNSFDNQLQIIGSGEDHVAFTNAINLNHGDLTVSAGHIQINADIRTQQADVQLRATTLLKQSAESTIYNSSGFVSLEADQLLIEGKIDTSSYTVGGQVHLLGDNITLAAGSQVDASGSLGGGTILIGGDKQGISSSIRNAQNTTISENVLISANASHQGNGGKVIVWSDNTTIFTGKLSAQGGINGGDGGFAEISGKEHLSLSGDVLLNATNGDDGTLLLDPGKVDIRHDPFSFPVPPIPPLPVGPPAAPHDVFYDRWINDFLNNSGNLLITTSQASNASPPVLTVESDAFINWTSSNSLTLVGENALINQGKIHASHASAALLLKSAGDISGSGEITVENLTLNSLANITLDNNLNDFGTVAISAGGNVSVKDKNAIDIAASTISGTLSVTTLSNLSGATTGDITDSGPITVTGKATFRTDNGFNITLNNPLNNFSKVSLFDDDAVLVDVNEVQIDDTNIAGKLTVIAGTYIEIIGDVQANEADFDASGGAGNILDTGAGVLTIATTSTFNVQNTDNIFLNAGNDFSTVVVTAANNVELNDTNGIDLGASTVGGTLKVTAGGNITDSGTLAVTGTTTLNAAANDITLDEAGNDFSTVVVTAANNVELNDTNGIDLGASTVGGTLKVTAGGNITDSGTLAVTGTTTLNAAANDITLDEAGNDFSTVVVTAANNVELNDTNGIDLGASTVGGTLKVTAGGNITDSGTLAVTGTTTLNAAANDITLDEAGNDFSTVVVTAANNVELNDTNGIDLGASTVGGTLKVTAGGNITDSGTLAVTGTTTLNAAANDITLDEAGNDFSTVVVTAANNVELNDTNGIDLGASTVGGTLKVTAGGNITDSGTLAVTGTTTLNAAANDITLDEAGNDFSTVVVTAANNVELNDTNGIDLGASTVGGTLKVTAGGNITDSGTLAVTGTTTLNAAANDITLDEAGNDFSTVVVTAANNVELNDTNGIDLGASTVGGTLKVTAGGNITDSGTLAVTGTTTLNAAANDITLDEAGNDFSTVVVTAANNVELNDTNGIDLGASTVGGTLKVTAGGNITDSGTLAVTGTTTLNAAANDITLDEAGNDFSTVVVTAANNVELNDTNGIDLGASTVGGTLKVTAGGNITDSGTLAVTGTTTLNAAANDITLDEAGNDFSTVVVTAANNVELNDTNGIDLGASTVGGTLKVTAGGNITDSGTLAVTGTTTLNAAANDITLDEAGNDFSTVVVTAANNVELNDTNGLIEGGMVVGNVLKLDVTAGSVTQTAIIDAPEMLLLGGADYTLTSPGNKVNKLAANIDGLLNLSNSQSLEVATVDGQSGITTSGDDITLNVSGSLSINQIVDSGAGGTVNGGNVELTSSGLLNINALITTALGTGGTLDISGVHLTAGNSPVVGAGNLKLNGGSPDTIIAADLSSSGNMTLSAPRDVIIRAAIQTTSAADIILNADKDNDGVGGVWINGVETITQEVKVTSGGTVTVKGSDLFAVSGTAESLLVDIDALTDTNSQIESTGSILFTHHGAGIGPDSADVKINGKVVANGTVDIHAKQDILFGVAGDLSSQGGNITLTSDEAPGATGGQIFLADGTVIDADSGDIDAEADGSITLGRMKTSGSIFLTSTHGGIIDGGDIDGADLTANSVALSADTGIGNGNPLETAISNLAAFNSSSGSIEIANDVSGLLTINTINGLEGVVNNGANNADAISIVNSSPIHVKKKITTEKGNITLTAVNDGGDDDHITVDALVRIAGGTGSLLLNAGTDLIVNDSGNANDVSVQGSGTLTANVQRETIVNEKTHISTNSQEIVFNSNEMKVHPVTATISSGTARTTIRPFTTDGSIAVDLGSNPGSANLLELSAAELDRFTTGILTIGSTSTGAIDLSAGIKPAGTTILHLITGAGLSGAGTITESNLAIEAGSAVQLTNNNDVNSLAINTTSGNISYTDATGFNVDTIDGVSGIRTAAGSVSLSAKTGDIVVSSLAAVANEVDATTTISITIEGDDDQLTIKSGAQIRSTGGTHTYEADKLDIAGLIDATSQRVVLKPHSANEEIDLGSNSDTQVNKLEISSNELNRITAAVIEIGSTSAGAIDLTSSISPTGSSVLHLITGGSLSGSGTLEETHVAIEAGDTIDLSNANDFDILAVKNSGLNSTTTLVDSDELSIGTVDGVVGLMTNDGATSIQTGTSLTIDDDINVGNATLTTNTGAGVSQNSGDDIFADKLELTGTGPIVLSNPGNQVNTIAANIIGELNYRDQDDLTVGIAGGTTGINVTGELQLEAGESLTVQEDITTNTHSAILKAKEGILTEAVVDTAGGELTADADTDKNENGAFNVSATGSLKTQDANGTITAADVNFAGSVDVGDATLTLKTSTPGRVIGLGGGVGIFSLTDADADQITATTLVIGDATQTGGIETHGQLTSDGHYLNLVLKSSTILSDKTATEQTDITVDNLFLEIDGGIAATGDDDLDIAAKELTTTTQNTDQFIEEEDNLLAINLSAGDGVVHLTTNDFLHDSDADNDIHAQGAVLISANGIGESTQAIHTELTLLQADGGSKGLFIEDTGGLTIGGLGGGLGATVSGKAIEITTSGHLTVADKVLNSGAGDVELSTTVAGNVTFQDQAEVQGGNATLRIQADGAIVDQHNSGGIADLVGKQIALTANSGIGSSNKLETSTSLLSANNSTTGNIRIDNLSGNLLTIGKISGLPGGVRNASTANPTGVIAISNNGDLSVGSDTNLAARRTIKVQTASPSNIKLTTINNGNIQIFGQVNTSGGDIYITSEGSLEFFDTGNYFDVVTTNDGRILGTHNGNVAIDEKVLLKTSSGTVASVDPIIEVREPIDLVSPLGEVELVTTYGQVEETSYFITIDWFNSSSEQGQPLNATLKDQFVENFAFKLTNTIPFDFRYLKHPEPSKSAEDIPVAIFVVRSATADKSIVIGQSDEIIALEVGIPVPGEGFGAGAPPPVAEAPLLVFPQPVSLGLTNLNRTTTFFDAQTVEYVKKTETETKTSQRQVILRVLSPTGKVIENVPIEEETLDNLPALYKRLPDGRYQIVVQESGSRRERIVADENIRGGKIADKKNVTERPPNSSENKNSPQDENPVNSPKSPQKEKPEEESQPDDSMNQSRLNPASSDNQQSKASFEQNSLLIANNAQQNRQALYWEKRGALSESAIHQPLQGNHHSNRNSLSSAPFSASVAMLVYARQQKLSETEHKERLMKMYRK